MKLIIKSNICHCVRFNDVESQGINQVVAIFSNKTTNRTITVFVKQGPDWYFNCDSFLNAFILKY